MATASTDNLAIHRFAEIFPGVYGDQRERMKASIKKNGVKIPVVLWTDEEGVTWIADGRTRAELCDELGMDFPTVEFEGTEDELYWHVMDLNFNRRHMTSSQLAAVAVESDMVDRARDERKKSRTKDDRRVEKVVADKLGTNEKYIRQCEQIRAEDPALLRRVVLGELTVRDALEVLAKKNGTVLPDEDDESAANETAAEVDDNETDSDSEPGDLEAPEEDEPPSLVDAFGHAVPDQLTMVWHEASGFDEASKHLKAAKKILAELSETAAGFQIDKTAVSVDVGNLTKEIDEKRPYTICPHCGGRENGCKNCHKAGWMPKALYERQTPEIKKAWESA